MSELVNLAQKLTVIKLLMVGWISVQMIKLD